MKEDRTGGRKGKEDRIGEKGLREKHKKNTNTKGNSTQIVTKTNQIFINNLSSFLYNVPFIEVEGRSYAGAKRRVAEITFRVVEWIDPRFFI